MDPARISALLEPFLPNDRRLTANELDLISTYIDLLLRWNSRINLTAIRDTEQIVTRHFGESFFMARHLFPVSPEHTPPHPALHKSCHSERSEANAERSRRTPTSSTDLGGNVHEAQECRSQLPAQGSQRILDLGSGAGFPGLPLKIWNPEVHLTLVESNNKKVAFLREVIRALTLTNVNVIPERAEALVDHPAFPPPDIITFRAVEKFDQVLGLALRLLVPPEATRPNQGSNPHPSVTSPRQPRLAILIGASQVPTLSSLPMSWQSYSVPGSHGRSLMVTKLV